MPAPSPAYYLVEDGRATGPHSLAVLRQKAEIFVLAPTSLVCPADAATEADRRWQPVREIPGLFAELFPARATPSPRLGQVSGEQINAHDDEASAPVDVMSLLRQNHDHAQALAAARLRAAPAAAIPPAPPPTAYRSRRNRDYIVCALGLTLFSAVAGQFVGYINPFLIGLFVMGHLGLAWVLYGVMDRY